MSSPSSSKRARGQYFTVGNPFVLAPFTRWFNAIAPKDRAIALEPFAGAGDIPQLMRQAGHELAWSCFDLDPPPITSLPVARRDTLASFPRGFTLGITNPPYLARNSASRRALGWSGAHHQDVYLHALEKMLSSLSHVAAIIPESFITRPNHDPRLHAAISLPWRMFADTDHPVCLALFDPHPRKHAAGPIIYSANHLLGYICDLEAARPACSPAHPWVFNDPRGSIGLRAVDNARTRSIAFVPGKSIDASCVKPSSRALTRISGLPARQAPHVIARANQLLETYRTQTHDVLMTSFKGLRQDGKYRRRLDYATARALLDLALFQIGD